MKIIKAGDPKKATKVKRFTCNICDCIFEADNTEYKYDGNQHDGMCYIVTCPYCNTRIFIEA